MQEYHKFTAASNLCSPPRTKPAPKRRRGETSAQWLARRHDALLNGCKVPDIDWRLARATAISEFDKARDTYEIWHSDLNVVLDVVLPRAPSVLISSETKLGTSEAAISRLNYAFSAKLHTITFSHMAWGHAVGLFEELDRRGLSSTSAIERAYRQDSTLMWQLVVCLCNTSYLSNDLWAQFIEVMSWCEYYRPYFTRVRTRGRAQIEIDRQYLRQSGGYKTDLDNVIIENIQTSATRIPSFYDDVHKYIEKSPNEAEKFSHEAYEALGDVANVSEFQLQLIHSAFGQRLIEFAQSKDKQQCLDDPKFLAIATFMDPSKLRWVERNSNDWSYVRTIGRSLGATWGHATNQMGIGEFLVRCSPGPQAEDERESLNLAFDHVWLGIDTALWDYAHTLDRSSSKGTVARNFGMFDPADPQRPSYMKMFVKKVGACLSEDLRRDLTTKTPPASKDVFVPETHQTAATSGHAYISNTQHLRAKNKVKTKGNTDLQVVGGPAQEGEEEEEDEDEDLPVLLPSDFKMGKKLLKVFHRIIQASDMPGAEDTQGPKPGQIRWGEFERAMKRIGFGVVQTAGSSVRFDPPAKSARPITFHRPGPQAEDERESLNLAFDHVWLGIDTALWDYAHTLDRSSSKGTVARNFGMFDPADPQRPSYMKMFVKKVGACLSEDLRRDLTTKTPPASKDVFVPETHQTAATSGHAYISNTQHLRAKNKVKTKGNTDLQVVGGPAQEGEEEEEDEDEDLPVLLPSDFKMGKKLLKVFHRIIQASDMPGAEDTQGPKPGQIRWGEFERAMKRIGFGVVQTAGSSVRFDPPAKSARPITFHRPHPDSTMTPIMLRWVGARLKRCYGWTTATFSRAAVEED